MCAHNSWIPSASGSSRSYLRLSSLRLSTTLSSDGGDLQPLPHPSLPNHVRPYSSCSAVAKLGSDVTSTPDCVPMCTMLHCSFGDWCKGPGLPAHAYLQQQTSDTHGEERECPAMSFLRDLLLPVPRRHDQPQVTHPAKLPAVHSCLSACLAGAGTTPVLLQVML